MLHTYIVVVSREGRRWVTGVCVTQILAIELRARARVDVETLNNMRTRIPAFPGNVARVAHEADMAE